MSTHQILDSLQTLPSFGACLRHLRLRAGLNQRDLAIAVGYSESQISRLEHGQRQPDVATFRALFVPALEIEDAPEIVQFLLSRAETAREVNLPLAPSAPPLPPPAPVRHELPVPLTSLINRVREVEAICTALQRADTRLLTVIGPPGIGKTRLSTHVAELLSPSFADGVVFVGLAPVNHSDLVLPTIGRALGQANTSEAELFASLQHRTLLLLLDNFEQVAEAGPQLARLLRAAPKIKALVTSRSPLHITGEHLYQLPPLELPSTTQLPQLNELACIPAIALFVARVQAVQPHFVLTKNNAASVVEICRRLDGLPLAIELAAARSRHFSLHELLERLHGPDGATTLHFLINGPRDLLQHQRTLRSAIDWSYNLLSPAERSVLTAMAAFVDGWDIAAASAVCQQSAAVIEPLLLALFDQSLIQQHPRHIATNRFSMLEMIREYALEQQHANDQCQSISERHAAYFETLASRLATQPAGAVREQQLIELATNSANLRAALSWLAKYAPVRGLRYAAHLRVFWVACGFLNEGRSWLTHLLERCSDECVEPQLWAQALDTAAYLAYQQGDHEQAKQQASEALRMYRELHHCTGSMTALMTLGSVAFHQARYEQATALYNEVQAIARSINDQASTAQALKTLAQIAKDQGDFAHATALHMESRDLYQAIGDRRGVAYALINLSIVAYWGEQYDLSRAQACEALDHFVQLDDRMGLGYALDQLAMAAYKQGDFDQAYQDALAALEYLQTLGDKAGVAMALIDAGTICLAQQRHADAIDLLHQGLHVAVDIGDQRRIAFGIEALAAAWCETRPTQAAELLGAAASIRERIHAPLPPADGAVYQQTLHATQVQLGDGCFSQCWSQGATWTYQQAVAMALGYQPTSHLTEQFWGEADLFSDQQVGQQLERAVP